MITDADLLPLYNSLNRQCFGGRLPAIPVRCHTSLPSYALDLFREDAWVQGFFHHSKAHGTEISINATHALAAPTWQTLRTLAHEGCHADVWARGIDEIDAHGAAWQSSMRRIGVDPITQGAIRNSAYAKWMEREERRIDRRDRERRSHQHAPRIRSADLDAWAAETARRRVAASWAALDI